MTHMTIFMSPEYSCLRICNIDDAKVIVIDRICTCSKLIFQPESNSSALRREIKTNRVVQRRQSEVQLVGELQSLTAPASR
ncbi:hypothetical protein MTR_3g049915 [Medicago truncatula]|uniref:Uncharacterized protein n=1 Tax=Medicago truncatula TaxID=3880 RepID=A0A072UVF2_MEDTR|nr:hypothetical protein MTR_3g049915 [Medicago truncatula]